MKQKYIYVQLLLLVTSPTAKGVSRNTSKCCTSAYKRIKQIVEENTTGKLTDETSSNQCSRISFLLTEKDVNMSINGIKLRSDDIYFDE